MPMRAAGEETDVRNVSSEERRKEAEEKIQGRRVRGREEQKWVGRREEGGGADGQSLPCGPGAPGAPGAPSGP
eukprot:753799-Hanusia_phi.AAC.4